MHSKVFVFSERVINVWNGSSADSVDFSSLVQFKSSINSLSFFEYLQFK